MSFERPTILYEDAYTVKDVKDLKHSYTVWEVRDIYEKQLEELFEIINPQSLYFSKKEFQEHFSLFLKERGISLGNTTIKGNWIYFPWNGILLHTLPQNEHELLRTNRNHNLITLNEQKKLLKACVGIVGLSVGNAIALNLVYNGIANIMKIADYDTLDTTNLNRVRVRLDQVDSPKIQITSRQIYEINPYAKLHTYKKGLNLKNLSSFFIKGSTPQIIFESIDDFKMKILIREEAKRQRVPVVMMTSLGDNVLLDIERYDIEPKTKPFNGAVDNKILKRILSDKASNEEKNQYAVKIVNQKNVPLKAVESVKQIGKTLIGRPQLMNTVVIASGIASLVARKIILNEPSVLSGRTLIKFNKFL